MKNDIGTLGKVLNTPYLNLCKAELAVRPRADTIPGEQHNKRNKT